LPRSFDSVFYGAAGTSTGGDGPIVTDQLYWHVDAANSSSYSGSGTTWTDLISGQNATLVNTPTYSTSSANGEGAFFFNGSDEYATTNFTKTQAAFSVSAWHKPSTQGSGGQHAIMNSFESNSAEWWALSVQGTGRGVAEFVCDNDSGKVTLDGTSELADSWQMITGTRSGSSMKLYVNTSAVVTGNTLATSTITGVEPFWIASRSGSYDEVYTGYISDLKIYTKELSASEVTQNYNALKDRYGL
tara:strand:+ start:137 stop:871 length:735 start_codon:yes stop_codon:yes gene_type:complete